MIYSLRSVLLLSGEWLKALRVGAGDMAPWSKMLRSQTTGVLRTHIVVEKNRLLQAILSPPHGHHTPTPKINAFKKQ